VSGTSGSYNAVTWLLDRNVDEGRGAKLAFTDTVSELTYGDLQRQTRRVANMLRRLGVRREERVAMIMLDTIDFPCVFLGAIRAGIVPVPLNTLLTSEQYAYVLADCRARVLLVSEALLPVVKDIVARLPDLEHVVVSGKDGHGHKKLSDELVRESDTFATAATHPDEPAFWLYSSGSTGMPKGVRHLHSNLAATADTYARQVLGIRENDVCLSAAKLFFAYGLGNAMTFPLSVGAATVLLPDRPTPDGVAELLRKHQVTVFYAVPTFYAAFLASPSAPTREALKLRCCVSAGEALPPDIGRRWKERYGVDVLDGIGSTEMLHIFVSNYPGDVKYGTTGRPVPGYDVRLVDDDGNVITARGEMGELQVRGPTGAVMYWNDRDKTRETFLGEWTRSGDKYLEDEDGYFVYCGRRDDMLKVGGIYVSPFEVEGALCTHPDVLEAAVVAWPDEDALIKPKAFVVLKTADSACEALAQALREHVKATLAPYKYPRWIEFRNELPKTATGKIQRFKLRAESV
jgi:4-hydroxybenzoate-CoA ligase